MKLAHSLALLVATALTIPSALANFHVVQKVTGGGHTQAVIACPSNYLNCECFTKTDRGADIGLQNFPDDFFSTKQNQKDGDGKPLGKCWTPKDPPHWKCGSTGAVTKLICDSYICGT